MERRRIPAGALIVLSLLTGCSETPPPAPEAPAPEKSAGAPAPPSAQPPATGKEVLRLPPQAPPVEVARVQVIELFESHRDTFPGPLSDHADDHAHPVVTFTDQGLIIDAAVARAIESGQRGHAGLEVAADVEKLEQARAVVVYRTIYGGEGRRGGAVRYLIFGKLPAAVPLPARYPAADRWEFDIATDGVMALAARAITAYPPDLKTLQLTEGPQARQLLLKLGEISKALPPGEPVEITTAGRTIAVSAKPVVADIEGEQGVEVIPAQDHGSITFTTRLTAIYRDERPLWVRSLDDAPAAPTQEKAP